MESLVLGAKEKAALATEDIQEIGPTKRQQRKFVLFSSEREGEVDTYPMVGDAFSAPGCKSVELTLIYL